MTLQLVLWWPTVERPRRLASVSNLPMRNVHFVGREESLTRIKSHLGKGLVTVEALHGLGGVGKTQLAIEYAHRHARDYDIIWWFAAERADLLRDQLVALVAVLGLPSGGDPLPAVVTELRRRDRWLLIFDNAEEPNALKPFLPGGNGHVIVTSRQRGWGTLGKTIDVDVMSRTESTTLLRRRVPGIALDAADAIAERLGGLPLAIEQAAAFLEQTGTPPEAYLAGPGEVLLDHGKPISPTSGVADVWDVSLHALRAASPASAALVQMCSFLGPEPIPKEILQAAPGALQAMRDEAADPVGPAVAFSLIRRTNDGFYLHRLTAAAIRRKLRGAARTHYAVAAATVLEEVLSASETDPAYWSRWRRLMPHVLAAAEYAPNVAVCRKLLHSAGTFRRWDLQPETARPILTRVLELTRSGHDATQAELADLLVSLGWWMTELPDNATARELFEESLVLHTEILGEGHPLLAKAMHGLAMALSYGDYDQHEALRLLQRAAEVIGKASPENRGSTLGIEADTFVVLRRLGRTVEAEEMLDRFLTHAFEVDDLTHYDAISLRHVGWDLAEMDDLVRACRVWETVLRVDEASFGPDHPRIAYPLTTMADLQRRSGDIAAARVLYERALAIHVETLGPDSQPAVECRVALAQLS
ncbi:FxSxx-COOH system tetratricopeptide repeat protein [Actinoplanes sp. NPDC049118]|uniref:FxSxx-COOH system tetratricopeptide repeat protein n=1 Tax=Actinoplanes sp. NPDC049118 TaxID=3155769 RepID=UPI00340B5242